MSAATRRFNEGTYPSGSRRWDKNPLGGDPVGLSGRGLDRFVGMLREAGLNTEITGQVPDGALVISRQDGPQEGAHLIVRAGPGYTPGESAPLAAADLGQQEDR